MDAPRYFQDTMVSGAFRSMQHDHFFRALEDGRTEMRDVFCFAAPLGVLGRVAEGLVLRRYMAAVAARAEPGGEAGGGVAGLAAVLWSCPLPRRFDAKYSK